MTLYIILLAALVTLDLSAEEIRQGIVQAETLRIRSQAGTSYEVLGQLGKGDAVKVVEEKKDWLKIVAPDFIEAWVSNQFISDGQVNGTRINVRAGPGVAFSILGKLDAGDKVEVLETKNQTWAKIKALPKLHVWVSSSYVKLEPLIVARNDEKDRELNDVKAFVDRDLDQVNRLQTELNQEKLAAESAKKLLEEEKLKRAQLEAEKRAMDQRVKFIEKLLAAEQKKKSKKLVINIRKDDELMIGTQKVSPGEIKDYYKAAGDNTMVFVNADAAVKESTVLEVLEVLKKLKAPVYLEDPSKLLDPNVSTIADEFKYSSEIAQKTYVTLTVKKPDIIVIDMVTIPEEHLESILKTYGRNFNKSTIYIQAEPGVDEALLDRIMNSAQESGFKLITYPAGADGHEAIVEKPLVIRKEKGPPLPPGRIRMTGYLLNVDKKDRHIVDFALSVKVNGEFYAIAYLKGKADELKDFYLKQVEIIGVQKKPDGWTRPLVFVENVKPLK